MPLSLCTITGTLYDAQGSVAAGVNVWSYKTVMSGAVVQKSRKQLAISDTAGLVSFDLPRNSVVSLHGSFFIGSTDFNTTVGVPVLVPDAASATLDSYIAPVTYGTLSSPRTWLPTDVSGSGSITLTVDEARSSLVKLTGVLTGNKTVVLPLQSLLDIFVVWNATSGAFTLQIVGDAVGSVALAVGQGDKIGVFQDGTSLYALYYGG